MSSRHIPGYFDNIMMLHRAKMDCFLSLSKGTTAEEKRSFKAYDVSREIELTIGRFMDHPEEIEENLPKINQYIFGGPYTGLDNWYKDEYGKAIVLEELRKFVRMGYEDEWAD